MSMKKELLNGLSKEQIAKIKSCKNQEEILKLAREEGVELSEEQLAAVNGGCGKPSSPCHCPKCKSHNIHFQFDNDDIIDFSPAYDCECYDCGYKWKKE